MNYLKNKRYLVDENGNRVAHVHFIKDKIKICGHSNSPIFRSQKFRFDKEYLGEFLDNHGLRMEE